MYRLSFADSWHGYSFPWIERAGISPSVTVKEFAVALRCNALCKLAFIFLLLSGTVVPSAAEESLVSVDQEVYTEEEIGADDLEADSAEPEDAHIISGISAGYRFIDVDGYGGRAAEYDYLHSSPVLGASLYRLGKELKYSLEGAYLNEKDYSGDFLLDYIGDYRLHLRTDSMFHNLDREPLLIPDFNLLAAYSALPDPAEKYGIRVEQDTAAFRYKIKDFPFHLNLGYWRLYREGARQLIFADQAFEGPSNFVYAIRRPVKRQIQEGSMGFDTHLGVIDVMYSFHIRQFEDRTAIPSASFVERPDLAGNLVRNSGMQQHNEDPDSRYMYHTVKLHTSLSGGIVGAASYSYGIRDNLSRLSDVGGADKASAVMQNAATDLVYTPCKEFSFALKYRLQQVDNSNPAFITSRYAIQPEIAVRPSLDILKNSFTATMSIRPVNLLSFVGEYKGEFIHRDNAAKSGAIGLTWRDIPENTDIHKGTFTIISRPVKGLRLKALYTYSTTDQPSYGSSFAQRHEGKFLATYNSASRWGLTAGYHATRDTNDQISRSVIVPPIAEDLTFGPHPNLLSREKSDSRVSGSVWFSPLEKLTLTASYNFLRTGIDQAVLLTSIAPVVQDAANFTSQSHIYSINSLYHLNEKIDISVLLQQVYSFSEFDPAYVSPDATSNTAGIKDLSRTKTIESSVSARSDFRITDRLSCVLDYSFRDYNDRISLLYDGTVQTYMVFLNAKW